MEWVARRGRKGRWQGASEAHPHRGCNKRVTQPAALLPRALKGCVDFGAGLRCSLGRDRYGYRHCTSRLGQRQNPQQRDPFQYFNSLQGKAGVSKRRRRHCIGEKGELATLSGKYSVLPPWITGVYGCLVRFIAREENERYAHLGQTRDGLPD